MDGLRRFAYARIAIPYGLAKDPIVAMDFIMVSTTIDSAFTDFKTHVKFEVDYEGQLRSDSDAMVACLKRAMDSGIPILDGKFLAALTRPQMEKIFAGNIEMPMLDEKLQNFREVGKSGGALRRVLSQLHQILSSAALRQWQGPGRQTGDGVPALQ